MEGQQFLALNLGRSNDCAVSLTYDQTIGCLSWQKCLPQHRNYILNMRVSGAATDCVVLSTLHSKEMPCVGPK